MKKHNGMRPQDIVILLKITTLENAISNENKRTLINRENELVGILKQHYNPQLVTFTERAETFKSNSKTEKDVEIIKDWNDILNQFENATKIKQVVELKTQIPTYFTRITAEYSVNLKQQHQNKIDETKSKENNFLYATQLAISKEYQQFLDNFKTFLQQTESKNFDTLTSTYQKINDLYQQAEVLNEQIEKSLCNITQELINSGKLGKAKEILTELKTRFSGNIQIKNFENEIAKKTKKRNIVYASIAISVIAIITTLIIVIPIISENNAWTKAQQQNNYTEYIEKYPSGKHIAEAYKLKEESFWHNVVLENTTNSFEQYLSEYPNGVYSDSAKFYIQKLDYDAWDVALKANTINSMQEYLHYFPNGLHRSEASDIVKSLTVVNYCFEFLDSYTPGEVTHLIQIMLKLTIKGKKCNGKGEHLYEPFTKFSFYGTISGDVLNVYVKYYKSGRIWEKIEHWSLRNGKLYIEEEEFTQTSIGDCDMLK